MIQTVVKRDGRIVGFNKEKIAAAIRKAMLTTEQGEDEKLINQIADRIEFRGKEPNATFRTATGAASPARRRRARFSSKSSRRRATTLRARMPT